MEYADKLNDTIQALPPSGIRKFFDIASEIDDVISLSVGEPDFPTPAHIRDAGIRALEEGKTKYTSNQGLTILREEISRYYQRKYSLNYNAKDEILVTVGGSEGIDLALRALLNPGDEVLIPQPSFVCYVPITKMTGAAPITLETTAENKFKVTAEQIEKHITKKTKAIVLPYPSNPTGAILTKEELEPIAKVIQKYDLMVLSDEIYSELVYDVPHTTIASLPGMQERTLVINGFSKAYSMTGWRMGYALGPKPWIKAMTKLHQFAIMSAPTISQYASIEALKNGDEDILYMRKKYDARRKFVVERLNEMGCTCFAPEGTFYVFPSIEISGLPCEEFCERMIYEKGVAVVPGTAFGACGEGHVRISYSYSTEHLKEGLRLMEEFINSVK